MSESRGAGSRRLGLPSAVALVVANMVGAGVFTTSGFALADLGSRGAVLLAWGLGGAIALCGAACYGALARRIPESGGEYTFLSRTLHPLAGFVAGWVSLVAGFTVPIAIAALALAKYLTTSFGWDGRQELLASAAIAVAAVMHGLRLGGGVVLQNLAVAAKLLLIAGFVALGSARLPALPPEPVAADTLHALPWGAFGVTLVWISYSYSGWNAAVYVGGEVRDPQRNLPRALLLATLVVTLVYLALNFVFVHAAPLTELAGRAEVGALAAQALGGPRLARLVSLIVTLALFTSISSMVMAGPRLYARMAADGLLPRVLAAGSSTPTAAVLFQAALSVVVVWSSGLAQLLGYAGFTLGLSAATCVVALCVLRRREGAARVPVPGWPWTPAAFVLATLAAATFMALREPGQAAAGLATATLALPVRAWMRRRR